jgi:hypothetical protein
MTAQQRPVVDDLGNITVHGRSGLVIVVKVETETSGVYEDISASDLFFEIGGKLRLALSAGADIYSRQVILTRTQVATLSINQPYAFAIHDETPTTPSTPWAGTITTFGFKAAPTGVADVDGEAANWSGATVVIQPGGGSPVVVVNYMGQPGEGIPIGGTAGQYLRKSSSTDYAVGWDTLTADDVSGLSDALMALGAADTSLTTRIGAEETARAAADTSLATAVAATYLPLAGGVMAGVLAFVAGTAALPGLAVAGDLNTGIYAPAADTLAVTAGGVGRWAWNANGHYYPLVDGGGDLGGAANRIRDGWFSRNVNVGGLVQLGGTTSSFGAWKSSGTSIQARRADDSAFASVRATGYSFTAGQYFDTSGADGVLFSTVSGTAYAHIVADAAHTLALRNGNNTQAFNIYRLHADASNYERLTIYYGSGFNLLTEAAGTGFVRDMRIGAGAGGGLFLRGGGTDRWIVYSTGTLNPAADSAYDLGSSPLRILKGWFRALDVNSGTLSVASAPNLNSLQTWNNGAVAFTALLANVTDTASASGSLLLDLQVGGASKFSVLKGGGVTSSGSVLATSGLISGSSGYLAWSSRTVLRSPSDGVLTLLNTTETDFGRLQFGGASSAFPALKRLSTIIQFRLADDSGFANARMASLFLENGERIQSAGVAGDSWAFSNAGGFGAILAVDAANVFALRNGASPQAFRVNNTHTDALNYERLSLGYSGGNFRIATEHGGTGSTRSLMLATGNTDRWFISGSSGGLFPNSDGAYDIGGAANKPANLHLANRLYLSGQVIVSAVADGVALLRNNAATGFTGIKMGGVTDAFPYLKVNGANLQGRKADDTDFNRFQAKLQTHANAVAETPTATHTLTLYDAAGTAYKVLAVAA